MLYKQVYAYKKADWDHLECLLQQVTFDCALWDNDINCN